MVPLDFVLKPICKQPTFDWERGSSARRSLSRKAISHREVQMWMVYCQPHCSDPSSSATREGLSSLSHPQNRRSCSQSLLPVQRPRFRMARLCGYRPRHHNDSIRNTGSLRGPHQNPAQDIRFILLQIGLTNLIMISSWPHLCTLHDS